MRGMVHVALAYRSPRAAARQHLKFDAPPFAVDATDAQLRMHGLLPLGGHAPVPPAQGEVERVVWPQISFPDRAEDGLEQLEEAPCGYRCAVAVVRDLEHDAFAESVFVVERGPSG